MKVSRSETRATIAKRLGATLKEPLSTSQQSVFWKAQNSSKKEDAGKKEVNKNVKGNRTDPQQTSRDSIKSTHVVESKSRAELKLEKLASPFDNVNH